MSIKEIKWNNKQYSFSLRAGRKKGKSNKKTDGKNKNQLSTNPNISQITLNAIGLNTTAKSQEIFKLD